VGELTSATVRHCQDGGGTIDAQMRPEETPPGKTESKDKSRQRGDMIQHTGDTLARRLDGRTTNVPGAA